MLAAAAAAGRSSLAGCSAAQHAATAAAVVAALRRCHSAQAHQQHQQQQQLCWTDLPRYIILLRHGESAGLEQLQEALQVPNHRVPLSARGVQESRAAGEALQRDLLSPAGGRLFVFTSPFLRCIQTSQHVASALSEEQFAGWNEAPQLREQDWGNLQEPGEQARNYEARLRFGRYFYRFPSGESGADVYDRMTMFQASLVRDIAQKRFCPSTSVLLVTHGLALRLFLMRWLHWRVDDLLQVFNPPTAVPIILTRQQPSAAGVPEGAAADTAGTTASSSTASSGQQCQQHQQQLLSPDCVKSCYALTPESLRVLRGVSPEMAAGRACGTRQELLAWRPYLRQVPPPPAADPAQEDALHRLMEIGYGSSSGS